MFMCADMPALLHSAVRKGELISAKSRYCVFYQADKPIRGTTTDINFPFLPLSPLSEVFFI